jgi:hypothetical protein
MENSFMNAHMQIPNGIRIESNTLHEQAGALPDHCFPPQNDGTSFRKAEFHGSEGECATISLTSGRILGMHIESDLPIPALFQ